MPAGSGYYAVHIIMDRVTGKSGDGFVELETQEDVQRIVKRVMSEKRAKMQNRDVVLRESSHEELMAVLFPRAKCIKWEGQYPTVTAPPDPRLSPFNGFLSTEELYQLRQLAGALPYAKGKPTSFGEGARKVEDHLSPYYHVVEAKPNHLLTNSKQAHQVTPFIVKHKNRIFETMISILNKVRARPGFYPTKFFFPFLSYTSLPMFPC